MKTIVTLGGANFDTHIKSYNPIIKADSNPSAVCYSAGGVVRNIAENLALLGNKPVFLGAVGSDLNGKLLIEYSRLSGIDMSRVLISEKHPSSCYIDFLQPNGEMFVAGNDMNIVSEIDQNYLVRNIEVLQVCDVLVIDANLPEKTIYSAVDYAKKAKVFADGTSAVKAVKFQTLLDKINLLKVNREELSALTGIKIQDNNDIVYASNYLIDKGLYSICVSLGSEGCYYNRNNKEQFFMALKPMEAVHNVTGCGDSMMAGMIHAFINKKNSKEMVLYGLACGKITAKSSESINKDLSEKLILEELSNEL